MMPNQDRTYQAYLLRLWRSAEDKPWRASLTPVGAEEPICFPSPERLWAFLQALMQQQGKGRSRAYKEERG